MFEIVSVVLSAPDPAAALPDMDGHALVTFPIAFATAFEADAEASTNIVVQFSTAVAARDR